jgi:hypothetical protein
MSVHVTGAEPLGNNRHPVSTFATQTQVQEGYHHRLFPTIHCKMSSFRFARSALRARPSAFSAPLQRRGYAEAVSDKIKLSLALPHQVRPNPDVSLLHAALMLRRLTNCLLHRLFSSRLACAYLPKIHLTNRLDGQPVLVRTRTYDLFHVVSRSTSPPSPERWVFSPTTFPPLSSSSPVLLRSLRRVVLTRSFSVRPTLPVFINIAPRAGTGLCG